MGSTTLGLLGLGQQHNPRNHRSRPAARNGLPLAPFPNCGGHSTPEPELAEWHRDMDTQIQEYREHLVLADRKAQESYDKTVLSLLSGALGISFAFVDGFLQGDTVDNTACLVTWWVWWGGLFFFAGLGPMRRLHRVVLKATAKRRSSTATFGSSFGSLSFGNVA